MAGGGWGPGWGVGFGAGTHTDWIGDGGDNLTATVDNWDNFVPTSLLAPVYNGSAGGSPNKDSTWNLDIEVPSVDVEIGYTGIVTQTADLFVAGYYTMVTNATQDWITNGQDLDIDGDISETGTGNGITHDAGGNLRLGGDNITLVSSPKDSPVVIHHSVATPTVAKTHAINIPFTGRLDGLLTVTDNQTIDDFALWCGESVWGSGVILSGISLLVIGGSVAVTDFDNIDWQADSANSITLRWGTDTTVLPPSDYGDILIQYRVSDDLLSGNYSAATFQFHHGSDITATPSLPDGCAVAAADINIGDPTSQARAATVTQESGSSLQATNDLIVYEDDGAVANIWARDAGSLDTVIGNDLIVQTLAQIAFAGDSSNISPGGDVSIHATSIDDFGETVIILTGTGTLENETQDNSFYSLIAAPSGEVTTMVEEVWVKDGKLSFAGGTLVVAHRLNIVGSGTQLVGAGETTFTDTGKIRVLVAAAMTIPAMNLGTVDFQIGGSGTGPRTITSLGNIICGPTFFSSATSNLVTLEMGGDLTSSFFEHGFVGDSSSFIVKLNGFALIIGSYRYAGPVNQIIGPGTIVCAGGLDIRDGVFEMSGITASFVQDLGVDLGGTFDLGTGNITIDRDVVPEGDFILGAGSLAVNKIYDLSSANSVTYGGAYTLIFFGTTAQTPTYGATQQNNITVAKPSSTVIPTDATNMTGVHKMVPDADTETGYKFLDSVAHVVGGFTTNGITGDEVAHRESTHATNIASITHTSSPVQRYSKWTRITIVGPPLLVDTLTSPGADGGGNTNIIFGEFSLPLMCTETSVRIGLGINL